MNLKEICKEKNMNCSTCSHSYRNFYSEVDYNFYCHGDLVSEDHVCLAWTNE